MLHPMMTEQATRAHRAEVMRELQQMRAARQLCSPRPGKRPGTIGLMTLVQTAWAHLRVRTDVVAHS